VTQIQIGLGAVVGHVDLAVLERRKRSGIDVDVRIELLDGHAQATLYQQPAQRSGGDSLP
jgi:hypothetical protein